jgi:hypothetical protein
MKPYEGILSTLALCKQVLPRIPAGAPKEDHQVVFEALGHLAAQTLDHPPLPKAAFDSLVQTKKVRHQRGHIKPGLHRHSHQLLV